MKKLPVVEQRDYVINAALNHILEEGCLCIANQAIRHPCETQANAIMDFFEHVTPLDVNRAAKTIGLHAVRDN
ncbi:MAG: hypothetical protein ACRCUJ_08210, partial [Phocaeicola sp.]